MPREFARRYRRVMVAPFAGDAAPAGPIVVNNPTTGAGSLFQMAIVRTDQQSRATEQFEGYFTTNVPGLTLTLQLWINSAQGFGLTPGDWIRVGDPIALVPANRLFIANGLTEDAETFVQVTPSAPLAGADTVSLFLEEVD